MSLKLTVNIQNSISPMLKTMEAKIIQLPNEALKEFIAITPIDKGNARRQTKLRNKTIEANYAYAERLNEGYSKQAPDGMTKPVEDFIQKRFTKIMTGK